MCLCGHVFKSCAKTIILVALITLISACRPAMPTILPTNTPVPHTKAATPLPTDTVTPLPSNTPKPTYTPAPPPLPYETITGQSYVEGDPVRKLVLYLPAAAYRKPLTLLVQGGEYLPELVRHFAELGYPVIGFNIRDNSYLAYLAEIQDGFCALAWAHTNADTYGFDAAQIVPVGGSMWGGNAALLGLVDDPAPFLEGCPYALPETGRVRAVITLAGVFDYSEEGDFFAGFIASIGDFMGGTPDQAPKNWAMASAITWVKGNEPPFLLVHGRADTNVAPHQSEKFAAALERVGADAELVLLPGVNHNTSVRDPRVFEAMQSFLERLDQTGSLVDGVGGMIALSPTPSPLPQGGATRVWEKDNSVMVYVPAGDFWMGSTSAEIEDAVAACVAAGGSAGGSEDLCRRSHGAESPWHEIYLDAFWIDRTEVTNTQYRMCVEAGICEEPTTCDWGAPTYNDGSKADHPVVCVDWNDARTYCQWASKRLPTEAEWEKAARGTDGLIYPWGDTFDGRLVNFCDIHCEFERKNEDWDDGYTETAPVGSYADGGSPYGAWDMAGNVWEWVSDWYDGNYYDISPKSNPPGPNAGTFKVARGGAWDGLWTYTRAATRRNHDPSDRGSIFGFRCCVAAGEWVKD